MKNRFGSVISYALSGDRKHDVKKGNSKYTEHFAYPIILPRLGEENAVRETLALRLAAAIAETGVPQNDEVSFGQWLSMNNSRKKDTVDPVEVRLMQMMKQPAEDAVLSISRLISMISPTQGGFNWYRLADVLSYWGNGTTEASLNQRQKILRDYFIFSKAKSEEDTSPEEAE